MQLALEVYTHLELVLPDQAWHTSGKHCRDLAILWIRRSTCGGPTEAPELLTEHLCRGSEPHAEPTTQLPATDWHNVARILVPRKWSEYILRKTTEMERNVCTCHWLSGIDCTWEKVSISFPLPNKEEGFMGLCYYPRAQILPVHMLYDLAPQVVGNSTSLSHRGINTWKTEIEISSSWGIKTSFQWHIALCCQKWQHRNYPPAFCSQQTTHQSSCTL